MATVRSRVRNCFYQRILIGLATVLMLCSVIPGMVCAEQQRHDDLFSVAFVNEKEGWACGYWGTVMHTADGGKSWVPQKSGIDYTLTSISFVDADYGWAVGDNGTIIHTQDGGKTWAIQKSPERIFLTGVKFVTRQKGWAVGEMMTILFTADGGKTWTVQFKGEDFILKAVSFSDENNGWAVGEYGYIYHTTDGGKKWVKLAGHFGFSSEDGLVEGGNYLFGLAAVNANTAWAVGIDGYVTMTSDSGKTWRVVNTGAPKVHLFGVAVNKEGKIAIGGTSVIIASDDNGRTWQRQTLTPPMTYGWIYALAPVGNGTFVAAGWSGAIYLRSGDRTVWNGVEY